MSVFVPTTETHQASSIPMHECSDPVVANALTLFSERDLSKVLRKEPRFFSRMETLDFQHQKLYCTSINRGQLSPWSGFLNFHTVIHQDIGIEEIHKIKLVEENYQHFALLLKKLIFNGITAAEWFLLYGTFEKNLKAGRATCELMYLYGLLSASSVSKLRPIRDFRHHTKKIDFSLLEPGLSSQKCQMLTNEAMEILKIPTKVGGVRNKELTETTIINRKINDPLEPNRIGVGYRDKGTLGSGNREEPVTIEYEYKAGDLIVLRQLKESWELLLSELKTKTPLR